MKSLLAGEVASTTTTKTKTKAKARGKHQHNGKEEPSTATPHTPPLSHSACVFLSSLFFRCERSCAPHHSFLFPYSYAPSFRNRAFSHSSVVPVFFLNFFKFFLKNYNNFKFFNFKYIYFKFFNF